SLLKPGPMPCQVPSFGSLKPHGSALMQPMRTTPVSLMESQVDFSCAAADEMCASRHSAASASQRVPNVIECLPSWVFSCQAARFIHGKHGIRPLTRQ